MPIEPPKKVYEIPQVRREEGKTFQQRKRPKPHLRDEDVKDDQKKEEGKTGKVDIKI